MSRKESLKIHVVQKVNEKLISQKQAADTLKYSTRHLRRMLKNYREKGISALIHQTRGKPSSKKLSRDESNKIIGLYKNKYTGFKPTHFTEMLCENENISRSKETVRQILINHKLWLPKPKKKKHRKQRERMPCAGMLVQMDGSVDPWFEDRCPKCVLMAIIDDAASIVFAKFYLYEGTMPALDVLIGYIQKYGIPLNIYADLHQTYHVNNKKLSIDDQLNNIFPLSKFQSAVQELGIGLKPAYSPQAKGRVERLFGTLQNRLKSELRMNNISSIEEANAFLPCFLKRFNKRFAKKHFSKADLHKPALPVSVMKQILAVKTTRHLQNDFTIRHNNHIFQITEPTIHKKLVVVEAVNGKIFIKDRNNKNLKYKLIKKLKTSKNQPKSKWILPKLNPFTLKEIYA